MASAEPWLEKSPSAGKGWDDIPFLGPAERAKPQPREPRSSETKKATEAKRELQRELHRMPEVDRTANPKPTANVFPPPRMPREARTVAPPADAQAAAPAQAAVPTQAAVPAPAAAQSPARPAQPSAPARTAATRPRDAEQELQRELNRTLPAAAVPPVTEALACGERLAKVARYSPLPDRVGPGACGATDLVRLDSVVMPDRTVVALNPAPQIKCSMAEQLAEWVREDVGPAATAELGSPLLAISDYDAYDCRPRNNIKGAKLSEHGKGNALDIAGIRLRNGGVFTLADQLVAKSFRDKVRLAACGRFMTVLGPGSDAYHGDHVHLDMAERSHKTKVCQWNVRETVVANAQPEPSQPVAASAPPVAVVPAMPPPPKVEAKIEPKIEPKVERKIEPKLEPKPESKPEPKIESKVEPAPAVAAASPVPLPPERPSVAAEPPARSSEPAVETPKAQSQEQQVDAEPPKGEVTQTLRQEAPPPEAQPSNRDTPPARDALVAVPKATEPAQQQKAEAPPPEAAEASQPSPPLPRRKPEAAQARNEEASPPPAASAVQPSPEAADAAQFSPPLPRRKPEALQTLAEVQQQPDAQNRPPRVERRRHDPARQFERDVRRFMRNFF